MNVLILTPDAVGSTLLQRLVTIYMQFYHFDQPVINLHELTNGLEKYYSEQFNQEILSKRHVSAWGYYQTLEDVVNLLSSVEHYKVSRLAHYHLVQRSDPHAQQIPFYRYLNDNFFVIACQRRNVFEHALSLCLNTVTKKLNVYSHEEKIRDFFRLYAEPVIIDQRVLVDKLQAYKAYLDWSSRYFNIGSYFYYDQYMNNIEDYILNLPVFNAKTRKHNWRSKFGISFNDWNRYHHLHSDLARLSSDDITQLHALLHNERLDDRNKLEYYQQNAPAEWPGVGSEQDLNQLTDSIQLQFRQMLFRHKLTSILNPSVDSPLHQFKQQTAHGYQQAESALKRMQELDIILSPPPIKKQTLKEKISTVKNFDQCVDTYNDWAAKNTEIADAITEGFMQQQIDLEARFWEHLSDRCDSISDQRPTQLLGYQNDDDPLPNPGVGLP